MKVLLTGASGFIGRSLARLLVDRGHAVRALVRKTSQVADLKTLGVELVEGNLETGAGLTQAVGAVECVIHLAGAIKASSPEVFFRCNATGTRNLAEAARSLPSPPRFIYCSSLAAAGPSMPGKPRREEDEAKPISLYGKSKLGGEQALRELGLKNAVIVRPPIVYGPGDREFLPSLLPMIRAGVGFKCGFGTKVYSFVHVEDLCEGILATTRTGRTLDPADRSAGVYFLSEEAEYTWEEVFWAAAQAAGRGKLPLLPTPEIASYSVGWAAEAWGKLTGKTLVMSIDKAREMCCPAWTCTSAKARAELGFAPRYQLGDGLKQALSWQMTRGAA